MAIDTTAATTAAATSAKQTSGGGGSSSGAAAAQNQLGVDYNNFLKLLTAQIQNQDPLKPMDSTQFVSQLAQLSQVEQAVQTNSNLEGLNTKLGSISGIVSLGLVGRNVTVASDKIVLKNSKAETTYKLASDAASVAATITDGSGNAVRTLTGLDTTGGVKTALNWDGKDDSGNVVPDGTYHVAIQAKDASGKPVIYDTYPTTTVNKVDFAGSGDTLELANGDQVPVSQIVSVN
jgi:flagellar basal-body rod modification protein FlgD